MYRRLLLAASFAVLALAPRAAVAHGSEVGYVVFIFYQVMILVMSVPGAVLGWVALKFTKGPQPGKLAAFAGGILLAQPAFILVSLVAHLLVPHPKAECHGNTCSLLVTPFGTQNNMYLAAALTAAATTFCFGRFWARLKTQSREYREGFYATAAFAFVLLLFLWSWWAHERR